MPGLGGWVTLPIAREIFFTTLVLSHVLGIQRLDSTRACTLFLLLRRLSAEETMSTILTPDCGVTGLTSFLAVCFNTLGPALNGNFGLHE